MARANPLRMRATLPDALLGSAARSNSRRSLNCPVCGENAAPVVRKKAHVYYGCGRCGAVFTPRIDPLLLSAGNEGAGVQNPQALNTERLQNLELALGHRPEKVVDLGSGRGQFVNFLMQNGISAGGVDTHTLLQMDFFADGSCDAVSMLGVIHRFPDPHPIFDACFRILKPSGVLYLEGEFVAGQKLSSWPYLDPALGRHLIHSPASVAFLAERHGFEVNQLNKSAYLLKKPVPIAGLVTPLQARELRAQRAYTHPIHASIIIPVFNRSDLTRQCLQSIFSSIGPGTAFEVIVVDNGSTDDTEEYLREFAIDHPTLGIIRNDRNLLFAWACNQGAAAAQGAVLVFLNNDTEPEKGWLETGLAVLKEDEGIGAVGARLLYPDGTLQHAGIEFIAYGHGYPWWPVHRYIGINGNDPRVNLREDVIAVTGACLFMRREVFEQVDGFDDSYIMYFEDLDLCFKLRRAGFRVVYEPKITVVHHEGRSSPGQIAINNLNRAAGCLFFSRWSATVDELCGAGESAPGREAFLFELDLATPEWLEVVLSYVIAFQPDEPVVLVLFLNPKQEGQLTPEAAQRKVQDVVSLVGRDRVPKIDVMYKPEGPLESLSGFAHCQWIPRGKGQTAGLAGTFGKRMAQARHRMAQPK